MTKQEIWNLYFKTAFHTRKGGERVQLNMHQHASNFATALTEMESNYQLKEHAIEFATWLQENKEVWDMTPFTTEELYKKFINHK